MSKNCKAGYIVNPVTNRCVKVDGKIGKQISNSDGKKQNNTPAKKNQNIPFVIYNKPKESYIQTIFQQIHPDTLLSKEAEKEINNHIESISDLAGCLTMYERNKRTCKAVDIIQAINIIGKGKDFEDKELDRLDKKRLEQIRHYK